MLWKKRARKGSPSTETGQEALYLKSLSERQVPVAIKLRDGEVVSGWIEYFDDTMVRLTREGKPTCSSTSPRSAPFQKAARLGVAA